MQSATVKLRDAALKPEILTRRLTFSANTIAAKVRGMAIAFLKLERLDLILAVGKLLLGIGLCEPSELKKNCATCLISQ